MRPLEIRISDTEKALTGKIGKKLKDQMRRERESAESSYLIIILLQRLILRCLIIFI